jgi:hypothetical protein
MVFNDTFNNISVISWRSDLLVEEYSEKPIDLPSFVTNTAWARAQLCRLQKGCTRFAAASDRVYQLLAHGRWFSPASSITKTGRHDIYLK